MKSNTRILKFIAIAAAVAGSIQVTSAAGLLGQRYVSGTVDWLFPDEGAIDTGNGLTALINQPLSSNVDLTLSYSYLDSGIDFPVGEGEVNSVDASYQTALFGVTFYTPVQSFKGYARLSAGLLRMQIDGDGENDGMYAIEIGAEVPAGEKATLTPYIAWKNTFDDDLGDEGLWVFGALAEFEVSPKWSLLARVQIDEDSDWGLSGGAAFRF